MRKNADESRLSTTEPTISSGFLVFLACQTGSDVSHEIVGRLCETPIQVHQLIKTFQKTEAAGAEQDDWVGQTSERAAAIKSKPLQLAAILLLMSFLQANPSLAGDTKIWEEFSGEKALAHVQRLVDLGHYDTKLFDTIRFVGANDGGSSTGLLLELARAIGQHPSLARKLELAFFDGEEAYENFSDTDGLYGSRYFARQLQGEGAKQIRGGILFDMVGDRSLGITLPADSPAAMARDVFAASEALKLRKYFSYLDRDLIDDHAPLNAIGIPTIDIIDFDYPWWHTADDTMDKISAQSLQIVGSVALYYLAEFGLKR